MSLMTIVILDVALGIIHTAGICLSSLRLYHRISTSRVGSDDYVMFLAAVIDTAYFSILLPVLSTEDSLRNAAAVTDISENIRLWLNIEFFFSILCLGRMSIALTIARVYPAQESMHRFAVALTTCFGLAFCLLQFITICYVPVFMAALSLSQCDQIDALQIIFIIINIVLDLLLIVIPLRKLWHIPLPMRQRALVLGSFAASSIPALGATVCAVFQFTLSSWEPTHKALLVKISYIETAGYLAACNLIVITAYFDNLRRRNIDTEDANNRQPTNLASNAHETHGLSPLAHSNETSTSEIANTLSLTNITDASASMESGSLPSSFLSS